MATTSEPAPQVAAEAAEEPCLDCEAPAGRFCYPKCPRYAEPAYYSSDGE